MDQNQEIADLRARLSALEGNQGKAPPAPTPRKRSNKGLILVILAAVGLVLLAMSMIQVEDHPGERIEASCEREYADRGEVAVNNCKIQLMVEELEAREKDRADRARTGAR